MERQVGKWVAGWIIVVIAITLVLSALTVRACFGVADSCAVEVVLNKPGVKYDLARLAKIENVSKVDYLTAYVAYMYKSHYDDRLIVVVSVQGLMYANVYATGDEPAFTVAVKGLKLSIKQLADDIERAKSELNWQVETPAWSTGQNAAFIFTKTIDGAEVKVFLSMQAISEERSYTVELGLLVKGVQSVSDELAAKIKAEIGKLLNRIGLPMPKEMLRITMIKNALARKAPEQEKYITIRIQIPLKQEVITTTVHVCNIEYSSEGFDASKLKVENAEKLGWETWVRRAPEDGYIGFRMKKNLGEAKLSTEGKGIGSEVYISLRVEGVDKLSSAVIDEFKKVLKAIGLKEEFVNECSFEFKTVEESETVLVPCDVSEKAVLEALKAELEWLLENGVITGLSKDDIWAIVSVAKLGCAGWNNRLVWSNGKWISYRLIEGAHLLRTTFPPPRFALLEEAGVGTKPSSTYGEVAEKERAANWFAICMYLAASVSLGAFAALVVYYVVKRKMPLELARCIARCQSAQ